MREEQPGGDDRNSSEELAESERGAVLTAGVLRVLNYAIMQQVSRKYADMAKIYAFWWTVAFLCYFAANQANTVPKPENIARLNGRSDHRHSGCH